MKKSLIREIIKIIYTNLVLILIGILGIEIFYKISNKEPLINLNRYGIPRLKCNSNTIYDVSNIYESNEPVKSLYIRNKKCYRSFNNSSLPKILVIGGSTTDERYVNEGQTFIDLLDIEFKNKIDFINGGVDGQSSHGHLYSIINWHSKALKKEALREIIFFIGTNDREIYRENRAYIPHYPNRRKLRDFLDSNSKIYRFIKGIYLSKKIPKNTAVIAAHQKKFKFVENKNLINIEKSANSINYTNHFKNLILETLNIFPNTSIKIIQQQISGCRFIDEFTVIDRHGKDSNICYDLGSVYVAMDKVVGEVDSNLKSRVSIHKMYLERIIEDEDLYDAVHTKIKGSKKIADYISSLYE